MLNIQGNSAAGLDTKAVLQTTSLTTREEFGGWVVLEL